MTRLAPRRGAPLLAAPVLAVLALAGAGVAVSELSLRTPTLDDVFLDVTGTHLEGGTA